MFALSLCWVLPPFAWTVSYRPFGSGDRCVESIHSCAARIVAYSGVLNLIVSLSRQEVAPSISGLHRSSVLCFCMFAHRLSIFHPFRRNGCSRLECNGVQSNLIWPSSSLLQLGSEVEWKNFSWCPYKVFDFIDMSFKSHRTRGVGFSAHDSDEEARLKRRKGYKAGKPAGSGSLGNVAWAAICRFWGRVQTTVRFEAGIYSRI